MPLPSPAREPLLRQFLNLLVSVRERPEDYCETLGELEVFLQRLYEICAAADGNAAGLEAALASLLVARGLAHATKLLTPAERRRKLRAGDSRTRTLIAFWTALDRPLAFPSPRIKTAEISCRPGRRDRKGPGRIPKNSRNAK